MRQKYFIIGRREDDGIQVFGRRFYAVYDVQDGELKLRVVIGDFEDPSFEAANALVRQFIIDERSAPLETKVELPLVAHGNERVE